MEPSDPISLLTPVVDGYLTIAEQFSELALLDEETVAELRRSSFVASVSLAALLRRDRATAFLLPAARELLEDVLESLILLAAYESGHDPADYGLVTADEARTAAAALGLEPFSS